MKMRKHLFCYIVCLLTFFNLSYANAAKPVLPPDFTGALTLQFIEQKQLENHMELSAQEYGMILWEIGQYFYKKYPDATVFYQDDFIDELRPFFPDDSDKDLKSRLVLLRNAITVYQAGRGIYDDIIKQTLVPHLYKAVHSEKDFDQADEVPFIGATEGEFVKVYNFKKFLSYSNNQDEIQAIEDFKKAHRKEATVLDKLSYAWNKIEWDKAAFYGYKYKNPLYSTEGVSEPVRGENVTAQLLARQNYIDGQKEITVAAHLMTDERHFVLANHVAGDLPKLDIDLSASDNVENYEILYPVPFASRSVPAFHKYFGDFLVPIKLTVKDVNEPVLLKAKITATTCNALQMCEMQTLLPELTIKPSGAEFLENGFDNFFAVSLMQKPLAKPRKLSLKKFVVDDDAAAGQALRLEFKADEKVHHFNVYVEEKDGFTLFTAPLISITDGRIFVRFLPEKPLRYDLKNSAFIISANLNDHQFLRQELFAEPASKFDVNKPTLNWGLIFIALLGGLILNFMPCVFPVLSFKITALSSALTNEKQLRHSLWLTVLGILGGFTLIIGGLLIAKTLGYALGWGMQYQHMSFLVVMLFVVIFLALYADLWQFTPYLPQNMISGQRTKDIVSGALIVLLATPCTGPYLATAVGFALTGNRLDIVVILYAVAVGLCLPYLAVLLLKEPLKLFPKPGKWMLRLNLLARLLMWLTVIWFISLIYRQTDFKCVMKLLGILLVFALLIKLYFAGMKFLDKQSEVKIPTETELTVRQKSKYFALGAAVLLMAAAVFTVQKTYKQNYAEHLAERQTEIDTNLIKEKLAAGRSVLLEIGADWCLTCHYNDTMVLTPKNLAYWHDYYHLDFIRVDWTNYNIETLNYMARYGRKGLPFYILYTPLMREGMVLPEIFDADDIKQMLSY